MRMANANNIDSAACMFFFPSTPAGIALKASCSAYDDKYYDNMFKNGPWGDNNEQAAEYTADIAENWSADKISEGSRFSIIFAFCGITFIMLAAANLCLTIGTYSLHARMTGICCGCCLGCLNFAALITTAVFRFNTMGKLAAISLAPS